MTATNTTPPTATDGLVRALGPFSATCIVIGAIIGVGIFFAPVDVAKAAGSGRLMLAAWSIGGGIALLGALTFAALGRMYPNTAGQYEILRDAYGPVIGFMYVFCNSTAIQSGAIALIAATAAEYTTVAVHGQAADSAWLTGIAMVMIIALAAANIVGVKCGSGVQNATTVAKLATLGVIIVLAMLSDGPQPVASEPAAPTPPPGGIALVGTLFAAMVPAFFAFGGWQHALWVAGEIQRPRRNLPLAIIGGVTVVVVVYVLTNWAYLTLLGYDGVISSGTLAADAVAVMWGPTGERIIAGGVAVSAFGVLNAQLLSGPRLVYGMAVDGRFFAVFGRSHRRFHTPYAAICMLSGLGLVLLLTTGKDTTGLLLTGVVMVDSIFFALTALALIILRRRNPQADRKPLGYPWVPALFVIGELGLVVGSYWNADNRRAAIVGTAWIVVALVVYVVFFRTARRDEER